MDKAHSTAPFAVGCVLPSVIVLAIDELAANVLAWNVAEITERLKNALNMKEKCMRIVRMCCC